MKNLPLISVIVTVYNVENYIGKCLDSICRQTYENLEIVVVNDGSTDNSLNIIRKVAVSDSRVKVINQENRGVVNAKKNGVNSSRGEYITMVDGDDWIETDRIQNVISKNILSDVDMIFMYGAIREYQNHSVRMQNCRFHGIYTGKQILKEYIYTNRCFEYGMIVNQCMVLARRDVWIDNINVVDEQISNGDDQVFLWHCLIKDYKVLFLENDTYHYVSRGGSITHSSGKRERVSIKKIYEELDKLISINGNDKLLRKEFLFLITRIVLLSDYDIIYNSFEGVLFPYEKIAKKSKIAIYGAGIFGQNLVRSIVAHNDYDIVAWIDQNEKVSIGEIQTNPILEIGDESYDFILIAILSSEISKKIKYQLIDYGVDNGKIRLLSENNITEENVLLFMNEVEEK